MAPEANGGGSTAASNGERSGAGDGRMGGSHARWGDAVPFYGRLPLPLKARRAPRGGTGRARDALDVGWRTTRVGGGFRRGCVGGSAPRSSMLVPGWLGVRAASGGAALGARAGRGGGGDAVSGGAARVLWLSRCDPC